MTDPLYEFERVADEAVAALPQARLPVRAILTGLHNLVFVGTYGPHFRGEPADGVGGTIAQRLSHVLPLLKQAAVEPYEGSATEMIASFTGAGGAGDIPDLLAYLHFSDLLPEVRRGYFEVTTRKRGFHLHFPTPEFADAQGKDITLSELAIPFPLHGDRTIDPEIEQLARRVPEVDWKVVSRFLATRSAFYESGIAEADLITDAGIRRIFGFSLGSYRRIRAIVLAYAELCEKIAVMNAGDAILHKHKRHRMDEALEWISVCQKADFLIELFAAGSGASSDEVDRFLQFYTIDFRNSPPSSRGGDGFFPPFARAGEYLIFSPILVLSFLSIRNAVFAFAKEDKKVFDDHVSHELEPLLLHQASELLRRGGDWIPVEDIPFPDGQIDLAIMAPGDDAILFVQAKGSLPPQGARMTERLADRVREGIRQIEKFERLDDLAKGRVIERVLGRKVDQVSYSQMIFARSCFGAMEVFSLGFPHVRMTLPLLSLALERHRDKKRATTIAELLLTISETEDEVLGRSEYRWEYEKVRLFGRTLQVPLLRWDAREISKMRRECWDASIRPIT